MKKVILSCSIFLSAFVFIPNEMKATENSIKTELPGDFKTSNANLITRLNEIKSEKPNLNRSEIKKLKKEVRAVKAKMRDVYGGVYISVGALIIILLLIIIFF
jgi:hypothetical protein